MAKGLSLDGRSEVQMNNQKWMSRATQEEKAMAYDLLVVGGHVDEVNALRSLKIARSALKRAPVPTPSPAPKPISAENPSMNGIF